MILARSSLFLTVTAYLHILLTIPTVSTSWNASLPMRFVGTCPVKHTRGTLSKLAVAIPVTRFVAPGPDVTRHTPTFHVDLAYPSAA